MTGWDGERRELELTCDASGVITTADATARHLLSAEPGVAFKALAVPGTEAKAAALLAKASGERVRGWELSLKVRGQPSTVMFAARPVANGAVALLGLHLPDGYVQAAVRVGETLDDVLELNREVARQKRELQEKHDELRETHRRLSDSNKGVLALTSELEERADALRHNAEVKARLVANVSHEFRTPLHTVMGLSKLLLDPRGDALSDEQKKQVGFIRTAAEELSAMVNDMLDLSKTEAGKVTLKPERFTGPEFISSLRGMLRPLLTSDSKVSLEFESGDDVRLESDRGKVAQVVRNLVSNALKFTETGEVRVSVKKAGDHVAFKVSDTGIGIAPENLEVIFEEFTQIDNPLQKKTKGTGLGLTLCRRLAEMLSGTLEVESQLGKGSVFTLTIPAVHPEVREMETLRSRPLDPARAPVLVVEDDRKTIFIYERYLSMGGLQVVPARTIDEARTLLQTVRPSAIVLDVMLENETSWSFLADLKRNPETSDIPVLVVTVTGKAQKARALGADEFWLKPIDQDKLLRKLKGITTQNVPARVLVIDDDEKARYLMRQLLQGTPYTLAEAETGKQGTELARQVRPSVIFLDFLLKEMTAFDVLDDLKSDPRTRGIPVVIITSHVLDAGERERLAANTEAIVSKEALSRELAINRIRDALHKAGTQTRLKDD
ncbi:MAG: response regulator [Archangiaceae bacterium]|nr:response regulator [Archangiaceae bacterium]